MSMELPWTNQAAFTSRIDPDLLLGLVDVLQSERNQRNEIEIDNYNVCVGDDPCLGGMRLG